MTRKFHLVDGVEIDLTADEIAAEDAKMAAYAALAGERLKASISRATQASLDAFARTRNYDGILSACSYASSNIPAFAAEGAYCVQLRDQTWAKLYEMLAEVQAGTRAIPAGYADIADELPVSSAVWPA